MSKTQLTHMLNPFRPGAGRQPAELVGRIRDLERMDLMVARAKLGQIDRGSIYYGLRGMGKTVLLNRMAQIAQDRGMCVAQLEADGDPTRDYEALFREMTMACTQSRDGRIRRKLGETLKRVKSIEIEFPIFKTTIDTGESDSTDSDSYRLEILVRELSETLKKENSGLFLFVDEFQEMSSKTMAALLTIQHRTNQNDLPFFIIGAGLPNLQGVLTNSRSYAERLFEYHPVESLSDEDTRQGFQGPAEKTGRRFDDESLTELTRISRGYPYFIQAYGMAAWDASNSNPITLESVETGKSYAQESLDHGLYESRWQHTTDAGKTYLSAMAAICDNECRSQQVANKLGKETSDLSVIRKTLIDLGLLYSPTRGMIAFTVPGMAEYIRRTDPWEDGTSSDE